MKKRLVIEIVCGVVIFVIGYFVGDASAIKRVNTAVDTKVSEETSEPQKDTSTKPEEQQKVYKYGEEGTYGTWTIKVLGAQEATTIEGGDSSDNRTTSQKFIVTKLQLTNKSQSTAQYTDGDFILEDAKAKTQYSDSMEAGESANGKETIYNKNSEFVGINEDINPNTPKQTYVIFEVPKDFDLQNAIVVGKDDPNIGFKLK